MSIKIILALLFVFPAIANDELFEVPRKVWLKDLHARAEESLCESSSYFRSCYPITETKCKKEVTKEFKTCLRTVRIPKKINALLEGDKYGEKIGICLGRNIDRKLATDKSDDPKCFSRNARW